MKKIVQVVLFLCLVLSQLSACSLFDGQPDNALEKLIGEIEVDFEEHQGRRLKKRIAIDYKDDQGRSRQDLEGMVTYYLLAHQKIHLLVHLSESSCQNELQCSTVVYVAMAGRSGKVKEMLSSLQTDIYRFNFQFKKADGDWLLHNADWQKATTDDIPALWQSLQEGK